MSLLGLFTSWEPSASLSIYVHKILGATGYWVLIWICFLFVVHLRANKKLISILLSECVAKHSDNKYVQCGALHYSFHISTHEEGIDIDICFFIYLYLAVDLHISHTYNWSTESNRYHLKIYMARLCICARLASGVGMFALAKSGYERIASVYYVQCIATGLMAGILSFFA